MLTPYYEDEAVRLFHGDCLDILPQLEPVDHVITDPPYSDSVHSKQWRGAALTKNRARYPKNVRRDLIWGGLGFDPLTDTLCDQVAIFSASLATRWTLVFSDIESAGLWRNSLRAASLEYVRTCVWVKPDAAPQFTGDRPGSGCEVITLGHPAGRKRWNSGGKHGIYTHGVNNFGRNERLHPSPKPVALMNELIADFTDEGETILDPFAGSGTTGVAAKLNGRKCILIEREEKYCAVAAKRLRETEPGRLFDSLPRAKQITLLEKP